MYRVLNQLLDVKNFAVSNDEIIIRFRNGSIQFNNMDITSINSNFKNIHFIHLDKIYFWCTTRKGNFLLDKQFDVLKEYPSSSVYWDEIVLDSKDLKLYSSSIEFDKNGVVVYDLEIRNLRTDSSFIEIGKKKILGFYYQIVNKFVFSTNENKTILHAYTLPTAQPLWQFSLSQLAPPYQKHHNTPEEPLEVASFIGVLGDQLWVALNHHTLIAINVQTGELKHQLSHIPGFNYAYGPVIPEPMAMHIDHTRNKLIALAWEYYWEVDPQTGVITMHNLLDYFRSLHLRNDLPLHTVFLEEEGQIFFVCRTLDNVLHYTESQVACFDIQTQKVVWQYKFQPNEQGKIPQPNGLQGNSQKIAVLDMDKTLHIFEKE